MPGCCVPQCSNHSRNGWKLYRFPRDPKRRLLWTVKIKRDKWQPTNTSHVCSAHFEENNYEQHRADGWKKLKPNAVPTLFTFKPLPKERKPPKERTVPAPSSNETNKSPPGLRQYPAAVKTTLETPQNHAVPESTRQGTSCYGHDTMEVDDAVVELSANTSDADSREVNAAAGETSNSTAESAELKKKLADLTRKYSELQQHHDTAKNTISGLKKKVQKLETEATNISQNMKFLNDDQVRALSRSSSLGNSWSPHTVKQGLQIKFACGTTGYETLRKMGYPLPSKRTLARRIQNLKFLPGVLHEVIDVMKCKAETMEDVEKDCVLFLDEMEIVPGFELDRAEDALLGGITLPPKPEEPAVHALVFMLGGLNQRWKQVIAYEFTGRNIDGGLLKNYVLELVQLCSQIYLRVHAITCDMGSANRAMWREFAFSSHRDSSTVCSIPHPCMDGKELFFIADPAHVLKNLRGQLLSSEVFTLSEATVAKHGLPSSQVNLEYVQAVLEEDSKTELKVAPNLSEMHTSAGHFTKMKVGVAVQLFREAPPAIRFFIKEGVLKQEAETTAWFMELISKWYALMSSRHPTLALSRRSRAKYSEALDTLHTAIETIRTMKMGATSHWKPSQAGVLISTTVVLRLQDVLLGDEGYEFFLTSRLLQDCLENLFSVVRLMKPVPNAYDLKCALRLVSVSQFLHTPRTTSYELDDREYLVDLLSQGKEACVEKEAQEIDDSEILFIEGLSSTECSILFYLGGFILKGILTSVKCAKCKDALLGTANDEHASLTALKEYVSDGGNLIYPSKGVMKALIDYEEHFAAINFWCTDKVVTMKSPLRSLTAYLNKVHRRSLCVCAEHEDSIYRLLTERYARIRLRIHLRQVPVGSCNGHASKTCAGVNLS
ncbi:uncharacterized protein LOC142767345 [Rhipicephalus microplus]|uniref:uncharacterized protein LOC142767345 n=1 Tax=Rhipicephalus microplus TaxID=6941 RepID=UPI003F6BC45C